MSSHFHKTGRLYPDSIRDSSFGRDSASTLRKDITDYASEMKFLLEQRDQEAALEQASRMRVVATVASDQYAEEGFLAYSASSKTFMGFTSADGWVPFAYQVSDALVSVSAVLATSIANVSALTSVNAAAITSINSVLATTSSTLATSIATVNTRITNTSAALATSIATVNTRITNTSAALATSIANLSATMAASIANYLPLTGGTVTGTTTFQAPVSVSVIGFSDYTNNIGHIRLYANDYTIGIEGSTQYYRSSFNYRWYIGVTADGGVSHTMQVSAAGLTFQNDQDVILDLKADTNNVTESDHAQIRMSQDGGFTYSLIGYKESQNNLYITHCSLGDIIFETSVLTTAAGGSEALRIGGTTVSIARDVHIGSNSLYVGTSGITTGNATIHADSDTTFNPANSCSNPALMLNGFYGGGLVFMDGSESPTGGGIGYAVWCQDNSSPSNIDFHIAACTIAGSVGTTGVYIANAGNSWTSRSDERDKIGLVSIKNGIDKIKQLRTFTGAYYDRPERRMPMLIAQDVQKVLPEAVSEKFAADVSADRLGMSYTEVIPLLTKALRESVELIETLQTRVSILENG